ncbi:aspartic peptidase domain-containing protein [Talaromyces proteolyticus]|uniref:Aspartic peptidase domain-containing protein n=1 Tax=Talaromyces proteolyticus TaxID=1131652 RepID=A0AAD4PY95_9EURO|nr:aspartic peptidase domain-containing protein [Talaromyces proteolyticus]KAH8700925.1 aspartic peptidase domain-containing protein [Talaromyces proteolyticus]
MLHLNFRAMCSMCSRIPIRIPLFSALANFMPPDDPTKSSTSKVINKGGFSIQYGTANSDVQGDYVLDTITVGGATVKNTTMAVAYKVAEVPAGILGIGFDTNEAIVAEGGHKYQSFVDNLVTDGVISTKAYSLWLNDLFSSSGSCLFGGYDTKKFTGQLLTVPIQADAQSGDLTSMTVAWTSLQVTTGNGVKTITSDNFASAALLDSGTTLTIIPEDLYYDLYEFFEAAPAPNQPDVILVECDLLNNADGTLNFQFGGSKGPVVKVPYSEFALPATSTDGTWIKFDNGKLACTLGLQPQDQSTPVILGDTFLRSAYVVYDLDNKEISIAQTIFNTTDTSVVEITKSSAIASLVTGVTVSQTASAGFGGIPGFGSGGSTPTATAGSGSSSVSIGNIKSVPTKSGDASVAGTSSGSNSGSGSSPSSSSSSSSGKGNAAGASFQVPGALLSLQAVVLSMFIGGAMIAFH